MKVQGDYTAAGYAMLEQMVPHEVAEALLDRFWCDLRDEAAPVSFAKHDVLTNVATEIYGPDYAPLTTFLWGATPVMELVSRKKLLPSYSFFRIYRRGDQLKVHSDRDACEHSLSVTLAYSDGEIWPFEIGSPGVIGPSSATSNFAGEAYTALLMRPGDAVAYRGPRLRHARMTPNPNAWSAHLFLHWVERDGPHRDLAFEERKG